MPPAKGAPMWRAPPSMDGAAAAVTAGEEAGVEDGDGASASEPEDTEKTKECTSQLCTRFLPLCLVGHEDEKRGGARWENGEDGEGKDGSV